jgi:RHS repeat-associated protein
VPSSAYPGPSYEVSATYSYDNAGRLVAASRPLEAPPAAPETHVSETWSHSSLSVTVHTDAAGRATTYHRSPDGFLEQMTKVVGGNVQNTTYDYAPFGLATAITDPEGNVSMVEYDVRGRPTMVIDPSTGVLEKGYTARGELQFTRDANGNQREFDYDSLGRLVRRATEDGTDYYGYDWGTGALGQLSTTLSADGVETAHLYDSLGRLTMESYKFGAAIFPIHLEYDPIGRLSKVHYPPAPANYQLVVRHEYGLHGDLEKIVDDGTNRPFWTRLARDEAGRVTHAARGATLETATSYDRFLGRPLQIKAFTAQTTFVSHEMAYHDDGRLSRRNDVVEGIDETYHYDALGRLDRWTVDRQGTISKREYEFGASGTLDQVVDYAGTNPTPIASETYTYPPPGGPRPHAPNSVGPYTMGYDAVGRQNFRYNGGSLDRYVEYNSHDLPKLGVFNGTSFSFLYDASGRRFRKDMGGKVTYYAGDLFEYRSDPSGDHYVYLVPGEGGVVAQVDHDLVSAATTTSFPIADHLGTPVAVVDEAAATAQKLYYTPYGRRVDQNGTPAGGIAGFTAGLTSHEHDDDLGLINMRGRVFDPAVRRFASPDPFLDNALTGGGIDRFSYVRNDPTNLRDPFGWQSCTYSPQGYSCDEFVITGPSGEGSSAGAGVEGAADAGSAGKDIGTGDAIWAAANAVANAGPTSHGGYDDGGTPAVASDDSPGIGTGIYHGLCDVSPGIGCPNFSLTDMFLDQALTPAGGQGVRIARGIVDKYRETGNIIDAVNTANPVYHLGVAGIATKGAIDSGDNYGVARNISFIAGTVVAAIIARKAGGGRVPLRRQRVSGPSFDVSHGAFKEAGCSPFDGEYGRTAEM